MCLTVSNGPLKVFSNCGVPLLWTAKYLFIPTDQEMWVTSLVGDFNLMVFHNTLSCSLFSWEESLADVPYPKRTKGDEVGQTGHKRSFNEYWRIKFLMDHNCPTEHGSTYAEVMISMLCEQQFDCIKFDTIIKYISRRHANLDSYIDGRKRQLKGSIWKIDYNDRTRYSKSLLLAPYKLSLIIGKKKKKNAVITCQAFVKFASAAGTSPDIFMEMPCSR